MDTKTKDKYADFKYEIVTPEELREAKWLIEQGDFKDMDDYLAFSTKFEIQIMERKEAEKKRKAAKRKKQRAEAKKRREAERAAK